MFYYLPLKKREEIILEGIVYKIFTVPPTQIHSGRHTKPLSIAHARRPFTPDPISTAIKKLSTKTSSSRCDRPRVALGDLFVPRRVANKIHKIGARKGEAAHFSILLSGGVVYCSTGHKSQA
jgi:hypothetical protein